MRAAWALYFAIVTAFGGRRLDEVYFGSIDVEIQGADLTTETLKPLVRQAIERQLGGTTITVTSITKTGSKFAVNFSVVSDDGSDISSQVMVFDVLIPPLEAWLEFLVKGEVSASDDSVAVTVTMTRLPSDSPIDASPAPVCGSVLAVSAVMVLFA
mmetsp:Transcript_78903/g.210767  ORF Transcript_78903/g.210767 Transcript_78903/m.210767 type:complete len:156 (-) Transcript_78903:193-660(-)